LIPPTITNNSTYWQNSRKRCEERMKPFLTQKAPDMSEKLKLRWIESVEEDVKKMCVRSWRRT